MGANHNRNVLTMGCFDDVLPRHLKADNTLGSHSQRQRFVLCNNRHSGLSAIMGTLAIHSASNEPYFCALLSHVGTFMPISVLGAAGSIRFQVAESTSELRAIVALH